MPVKMLTDDATALWVGPEPRDAHVKLAVKRKLPILDGPASIERVGQSFVERYLPRAADEWLGSAQALSQARQWLQSFRPGSVGCLMITGPIGSGKTALAGLALRLAGFAGTTVEPDDVGRGAAAASASSSGSKAVLSLAEGLRVMCLDPGLRLGRASGADAPRPALVWDGLEEAKDVTQFSKFATEASQVPIVALAPAYDRYIKDLERKMRSSMRVVRLYAHGAAALQAMARRVMEQERIDVPAAQLAKIVERSRGDMRQLLIQLEWYGLCQGRGQGAAGMASVRDPQLSLFESAECIFAPRRSLDERCRLAEEAEDLLGLMVQENYVHRAQTIEQAAAAANALSVGELVWTRRQLSDAEKHMLGAAVPIALVAPRGSGPLAFPSFLGNMSRRTGTLNEGRRMRNRQIPAAPWGSYRSEHVPFLAQILWGLLKQGDVKGAARLMQAHGVLRMDIDTLIEWADRFGADPGIEGKVKAALTRITKPLELKA